jgi:hypothetical protein
MKRAWCVLSIVLLVPLVVAVAGCAGSADATSQSDPTVPSAAPSVQPGTETDMTAPAAPPDSGGPTTVEQQSATTTVEQQSTTTSEPSPTSWVIYINDDDSYTEGDITYSIALNLTATNPSPDIAGTYTGSATAKTDVNGTVRGQPLSASSIVNSTKLEFTLEDPLGGGTLETLTPTGPEELVYSGSGAIVMAAAGSGSVGPAGGVFQNTSGQTIEVTVKGSVATLSVVIEGHTYTFEGTIGGA